MIVRLKVDRANEESAERGQRAREHLEERLCNEVPSDKPAFRFCSTIVLSTLGLGLPGAPSASPSTSASSELSCSSEYVFMLDLLPVPFQQRRGTQQSDRCQAHSEDLHTHTYTYVHTYLFTEPARYLPSNSIWLRINPSILFLPLYTLGTRYLNS